MDTMKERDEALESMADMISRSEKAQAKFAPGTSQHTLQKNRIHALRVAAALVGREAEGGEALASDPKEDLEKACAPLASLISKSEKARQKLAPETWQHNMLTNNLNALRRAEALLSKALAHGFDGQQHGSE